MITGLLITTFLIFLNGFFVAAEFAIVKIRAAQLEVKVKQGSKQALRVQDIHNNLDKYLSASQIGITLASLGLGWIGESTFTQLMTNFLTLFGIGVDTTLMQSLSIPLAFIVITMLHIVIGEQLPKYIAIDNPLGTSLKVSRGLKWFHIIFAPFNRLLYRMSNALARLVGVDPELGDEAHNKDEICYMLNESEEGGFINSRSHELITNVFSFDDREVRQIYTPRQFVAALDINWSKETIIDKIIEEGYSRYPVYQESFSNSIGILYTKDLMKLLASDTLTEENFRALLRPSMTAPLTQSVHTLFKKMQSTRTHLVLVHNEFGDIVGLITLEDIIEELVGEIFDETDDEGEQIINHDDGSWTIQGSVSLVDVNDMLPFSLPEADSYTTLAGYLIECLDRMPRRNETIEDHNYRYTVQDIFKRQVKGVHIQAKIALED